MVNSSACPSRHCLPAHMTTTLPHTRLHNMRHPAAQRMCHTSRVSAYLVGWLPVAVCCERCAPLLDTGGRVVIYDSGKAVAGSARAEPASATPSMGGSLAGGSRGDVVGSTSGPGFTMRRPRRSQPLRGRRARNASTARRAASRAERGELRMKQREA